MSGGPPILQRHLPAPLDEFVWIYEQMGSLGWSPAETDLMEVWQIAAFLGVGDGEVVIRGSRGLTKPSDRQDRPGSPSRSAPFRDGTIERRAAAGGGKILRRPGV